MTKQLFHPDLQQRLLRKGGDAQRVGELVQLLPLLARHAHVHHVHAPRHPAALQRALRPAAPQQQQQLVVHLMRVRVGVRARVRVRVRVRARVR